MNAEEIRRLFRPDVLLHVDNEICAANGNVIANADSLIAVRIWNIFDQKEELAVWKHPGVLTSFPDGYVSVNDLAQASVRPATADEVRHWIVLGESS